MSTAEPVRTDDALKGARFWTFVVMQVVALAGEVWLMAWPPIVCGTC